MQNNSILLAAYTMAKKCHYIVIKNNKRVVLSIYKYFEHYYFRSNISRSSIKELTVIR